MMRAHEIAAKAAELVGGDRAKTHGSKVANHENIATLWRGYLRNKACAGGNQAFHVTALDVANMMELLKVARRQAGAHNADDYIDGAGYASVAGEIAEHMALAEAAAKASARVDDGADAPGEGLVAEPRVWGVFNTETSRWWTEGLGLGSTTDPAKVWRMSRAEAQRLAAEAGAFYIAQPAPPLPAAVA